MLRMRPPNSPSSLTARAGHPRYGLRFRHENSIAPQRNVKQSAANALHRRMPAACACQNKVSRAQSSGPTEQVAGNHQTFLIAIMIVRRDLGAGVKTQHETAGFPGAVARQYPSCDTRRPCIPGNRIASRNNVVMRRRLDALPQAGRRQRRGRERPHRGLGVGRSFRGVHIPVGPRGRHQAGTPDIIAHVNLPSHQTRRAVAGSSALSHAYRHGSCSRCTSRAIRCEKKVSARGRKPIDTGHNWSHRH
jgi:hypothetical protein